MIRGASGGGAPACEPEPGVLGFSAPTQAQVGSGNRELPPAGRCYLPGLPSTCCGPVRVRHQAPCRHPQPCSALACLCPRGHQLADGSRWFPLPGTWESLEFSKPSGVLPGQLPGQLPHTRREAGVVLGGELKVPVTRDASEQGFSRWGPWTTATASPGTC